MSALTAPAPPLPGAVFDAFLTGRSARTRRAYHQDLNDFAAFLGEPTAREAALRFLLVPPGRANEIVLGYRAALLERALAPATINRRLAALRSLMRLARLLGVASGAIEVPNLRAQTYRDTRGPGIEAVRAMLTALEATPTPAATRDRAILRLLFDLGLRRSEVAGLDLADVDTARQALAVLGKGKREKEWISLAEPTSEAILSWLTHRGTAPGPLFFNFDPARKNAGRLTDNGIYRIVRARASAVGVRTAPHGLRHTAITEACKAATAAGIGLEEVQDFSRHRSVQTLLLYRDRERNVQGTLTRLVAAQMEAAG